MMFMENPTTIQGVNSTTFKAPPFKEEFLSLPELFDWHGVHSKDHPFFVYFDQDRGERVVIRWEDAARVVRFVANWASTAIEIGKGETSRPLVAFYSSSDVLTYILSFVGIMHAGFPVFLISNRMAPVAIKHLLTASGVSYVFSTSYDQSLAENMKNITKDLDVKPTIACLPSLFEVLHTNSTVPIKPAVKLDPDATCMILHSSGSTALPKPNYYTYKMFLPFLYQPWYGERDVCGQVLSTASNPMAGGLGVIQVVFAASTGIVLSGLQPTNPPTVPNSDNVWKSLIDTQSTYILMVPTFIGIWAQDPEKIKGLAKLEGVSYGGGAFPRDVGDKLAANGVEIFPLFAMTELGVVSAVFPKKMGRNWEWFWFHPFINPKFRPDVNERTAELLVTAGTLHRPTRFNTEFDGVPAYETGDILESHPTIPGLWRYVCRVSDQETLGGGPKVNIVAFARLLMQDPFIVGAVLVSHTGVDHSIICGVIIEPDKTHNDLTDPSALNAYKDLIWPTLDGYNNLAPEAGRLTRERIIIASKDKPLAYSEKGMPRRKEAIAMYHDEIHRLV